MAGFNLDTFGEIMDKFLFENEVVLQVRLPENSEEAKVVDNVGQEQRCSSILLQKH